MTTQRRKRHSAEQIIRKLRDADAMLAGKSLEDVLQALETSEATLHRWRSQYGGMKAEEAKRLKKLLAEAELDKAILKEALRGNV
jgi:transposase-like protein